MKNKELIALLQQYDPEARVVVEGDEVTSSNYVRMVDFEIESVGIDGKGDIGIITGEVIL